MSDIAIKPNVYIDFNIIKNSEIEALQKEFQYIIGLNRIIIVWSKQHTLEEMLAYCTANNLTDYIWDYKLKDSFLYSSVDFVIDTDKKLVDRFVRNGKLGNHVDRIQ